jgi:hypothetical protein
MRDPQATGFSLFLNDPQVPLSGLVIVGAFTDQAFSAMQFPEATVIEHAARGSDKVVGCFLNVLKLFILKLR